MLELGISSAEFAAAPNMRGIHGVWCLLAEAVYGLDRQECGCTWVQVSESLHACILPRSQHESSYQPVTSL